MATRLWEPRLTARSSAIWRGMARSHTEVPDGAGGAVCSPPGTSGSRYHSTILPPATRLAPRAPPARAAARPVPLDDLPPGAADRPARPAADSLPALAAGTIDEPEADD